MKDSIAACSACSFNSTDAVAEGGIEADAGWEPTMTETRDEAIREFGLASPITRRIEM